MPRHFCNTGLAYVNKNLFKTRSECFFAPVTTTINIDFFGPNPNCPPKNSRRTKNSQRSVICLVSGTACEHLCATRGPIGAVSEPPDCCCVECLVTRCGGTMKVANPYHSVSVCVVHSWSSTNQKDSNQLVIGLVQVLTRSKLELLLGARTLLGAPGIATRSILISNTVSLPSALLLGSPRCIAPF